jgi:hypothetical protein
MIKFTVYVKVFGERDLSITIPAKNENEVTKIILQDKGFKDEVEGKIWSIKNIIKV